LGDPCPSLSSFSFLFSAVSRRFPPHFWWVCAQGSPCFCRLFLLSQRSSFFSNLLPYFPFSFLPSTRIVFRFLILVLSSQFFSSCSIFIKFFPSLSLFTFCSPFRFCSSPNQANFFFLCCHSLVLFSPNHSVLTTLPRLVFPSIHVFFGCAA